MGACEHNIPGVFNKFANKDLQVYGETFTFECLGFDISSDSIASS